MKNVERTSREKIHGAPGASSDADTRSTWASTERWNNTQAGGASGSTQPLINVTQCRGLRVLKTYSQGSGFWVFLLIYMRAWVSASGWVHFLFWVSFVLFGSCRERARSRSCFTSAFTLSSRVKCQTQTEIRLKNTGDDVDSTREYGLTYSCGPEALTLCSADWRDGGDSSQGQRWFSGITKLLHVRCSQEGLWDHRRGNWVCVNIQYVKVTQTTYTVEGMNANSQQMGWNSSELTSQTPTQRFNLLA